MENAVPDPATMLCSTLAGGGIDRQRSPMLQPSAGYMQNTGTYPSQMPAAVAVVVYWDSFSVFDEILLPAEILST